MSIRFASIGTGWIAGEFLKGAREVEGLEYTACYSRSQEKGEEFAKQWGAQKVYTDLEAMAEDKEIDAVYIASPNALHYSQSKLFLQHGKHVICEKPITVEPEQLMELQQLAEQKGFVYMEALIGVYLPEMRILQGAVERLGGVHLARLDFRSILPSIRHILQVKCQTSLIRRWQPAADGSWNLLCLSGSYAVWYAGQSVGSCTVFVHRSGWKRLCDPALCR